MTPDFLSGAFLGLLAGVGIRWSWRGADDPRQRAEAVARVRLTEIALEKPCADAALVRRIERPDPAVVRRAREVAARIKAEKEARLRQARERAA